MPTMKYKPTTPSRRHMSAPSFDEVTKFHIIDYTDGSQRHHAVTKLEYKGLRIRVADTAYTAGP